MAGVKTFFLSRFLAGAAFGLAGLLSSAAASSVSLRVELDRPVLPAATTQTAIVKVALDGHRPRHGQRPPVNLALVIDRSGSMSGDKIRRAREAALEAVRRLSPDDIVSLVVYDTEVDVLVPARPVGDGRALAAAIEGVEPGGSTNLHGGVVEGAAQVRRHRDERHAHRIILLSDGQANVGPSSPEALASLGAELVGDGISVTTIGLGLDFNEDLMTRLARRSDGNTYFVQHSRDLARIFQAELGDVLTVVARRVVVTVDFPAGVTPRRVVGRDGRVERQQAIVEINQLSGGREAFALIEVEVEPGVEGRRREIARARVTYEDAATAQAKRLDGRAAARFSGREEEVVAAANHGVQAAYAANVLAETKDEVVELVDAGRRSEAAQRLRAVSAGLAEQARRYGNREVAAMAAPPAAVAAVVEERGLDNVERKTLRAEAAQVVNQQAVPNAD